MPIIHSTPNTSHYKIHIRALQGVLPSFKVDARQQLAQLGINDKKAQDSIIERSGYEYVHMLIPPATTTDMMLACARKLLAQENLQSSEIDAIISITQSPDYLSPGNSFFYLYNLGISKNCVCIDLFDDGSGFINALLAAANLISTGSCKRILLIAGDCARLTTTNIGDTTVPLFGDGGGVAIIECDNSCISNSKSSNLSFYFEHVSNINKSITWAYNLTASHRKPSTDALKHATPRVSSAKLTKEFCHHFEPTKFNISEDKFTLQFAENVLSTLVKAIDNTLTSCSINYGDLGAAICAPIRKDLLELVNKNWTLYTNKKTLLHNHNIFDFLNKDLGHVNSGALPIAISYNLALLPSISKKPTLLVGIGATMSLAIAVVDFSCTNIYPTFYYD